MHSQRKFHTRPSPVLRRVHRVIEDLVQSSQSVGFGCLTGLINRFVNDNFEFLQQLASLHHFTSFLSLRVSLQISTTVSSPSMVSRRGSRTPLVAILSVAGTILFFRYAFNAPGTYGDSGSTALGVNASYNEYLGGKARLLAEQLVMNKGLAGAAGDFGSRTDGSYDGRRLPVKKYNNEVNNEDSDWAPIKQNGAGIDPVEFYGSNDIQGPVRLCPDCDCTTPGAYANSPAFFTPVPTLDTLRKQISKKDGTNWNSPGMLRYLLHKIQLHSVLEGLFLTDEAVAWLLTNQFTCPDMLISYNFTGLVMDKPTSYIYTRTGPGGKLSKWTDRAMYMERHVGVIHEYEELVRKDGFLDGAKDSDRQMLWLVVEDESQMESGMEELLRASGIRECS